MELFGVLWLECIPTKIDPFGLDRPWGDCLGLLRFSSPETCQSIRTSYTRMWRKTRRQTKLPISGECWRIFRLLLGSEDWPFPLPCFFTITQYRKRGTGLGCALRLAAVTIPGTAYKTLIWYLFTTLLPAYINMHIGSQPQTRSNLPQQGLLSWCIHVHLGSIGRYILCENPCN